jgi:hypothetical protein
MADQQTPPNENDSPEQTKPDQNSERKEEQQPQGVSVAQQDLRAAPGRRPLFRSN